MKLQLGCLGFAAVITTAAGWLILSLFLAAQPYMPASAP